MSMLQFWVECDLCGEPSGDMGVPVPAEFSTAEEAIDHAVNECEWTRMPDGRLLCASCTPDD